MEHYRAIILNNIANIRQGGRRPTTKMRKPGGGGNRALAAM